MQSNLVWSTDPTNLPEGDNFLADIGLPWAVLCCKHPDGSFVYPELAVDIEGPEDRVCDVWYDNMRVNKRDIVAWAPLPRKDKN